MKKGYRLLTMLLTACMLLHLGAVESRAFGEEAYTYTVTFHAGNQGVFPAGNYRNFLSVIGNSGNWQADCFADGSTIIVSGITAGAQVSYDAAAEGAVVLPEGSRYYVMGVRRSGYDNADAGNTIFTVTRDLDHVAAYGIRGEMTSYRVNYEDAAGNRLADSRVYIGKVGDRPVAAYQYIEGWRPQAYNLMKTLSKNEAENIFTFVYTRESSGSSGGSSSGEDAGGGAAAGVPDAGAAGTAGITGGIGTGGTAGTGTPAGAGGIDAGAETAVPDTEVPAEEEPRDLINLDDEETPLANLPSDQENTETNAGMVYGLPVLASVSLILVAILAIYGIHRYRVLYKRDDEEDGEDT